MSRADLPSIRTTRWVASRKGAVVKAVAAGLIRKSEALEMYALSDEELDGWMDAMRSHGERALKTTAIKRYRQP